MLPSASVTIAFLKSLVYPKFPLNVFGFPLRIFVLTFKTLTLNIFSIADLISTELLFLLTTKLYWLNCCKVVDFSVVKGLIIMSNGL